MQTDQNILDRSAFDAIADLAQRESGLQLVPEKMQMVQSRLKPRLRALALPDFDSYAQHVQSDLGRSELRYMLSALTTNVTHFFREHHHFEFLNSHAVPLFRRKIENGERIRIWSAGCSKGQEPYSIAMYLLDALPALEQADFRILATDIDPRVIEHARAGAYDPREVEAVPEHLSTTFFDPVAGNRTRMVADRVARLITFRELNLMQHWPMTGRFDVIFCRNVVIYFNAETQDSLWPRFTAALQPGGLFFLGHSERIAQPAHYGLSSIGATSYALTPRTETHSRQR